MIIYADYAYYTNDFGGVLIPEANWNRAAGKACDYLNAVTFRRIDAGSIEEYGENIKRCCCEMAEYIFAYAEAALQSGNAAAGAKSSETIGAYSVSYKSPSETISSLLDGKSAGLEDILYGIAYKHLSGTGLLYRGVN